MEEWKEYKIGDLFSHFKSGKGIKADEIYSSGKYPVFGGNGLRGYTNQNNFNGDCAIIGRQGAFCGNVRYFKGKAYMTEHAIVAVANENNNTRFLAYLLGLMKLGRFSGQSAQPGLSVTELTKQPIVVPSLSTQKRIASILSSLDDKIELNRRINENLEQQAQALFKSWFVDFEPFKDGQFVDSELGMIPEGWKVVNLLNIAELYDSFRRPLSSRDRAPMEKLYPYYGATSVMDYVDNYIFDGIYLLMGEDGSVINEKGYPYLQYVFGKFWPNNHAHVMQGKNGFTTEMLHCFLLKKNISGIVTGAVQAKISQQSMKKILLAIPNENLCGEFACLIVPIYANIRNIINENRILSQLRNTLLPRLMSGELEIKDNSYD